MTNYKIIVLGNAAILALVATSLNICAQDAAAQRQHIDYELSTFVYKVVDDHEIKADVYRASGDEIRPVLLYIHGGALIFGSREWIKPWQLKEYLDAGLVIVSIDYRLAPETKLDEIAKDVDDAYSWLRSKGPSLFKIDADRVAVVGHSAGGYLTLLAGKRLSPKPRALVSFYGYGEVTGDWYSRPSEVYTRMPAVSKAEALATIGDEVISGTPGKFSPDGRLKFYLYCRQQGIWPNEVGGHNLDDQPIWFKPYEPVRHIDSKYPPTMLLHGEKDTDVPFDQSVALAKALGRNEVPHEFIRNAEWGHTFDMAANDKAVRDAFSRVITFLVERLKIKADR